MHYLLQAGCFHIGLPENLNLNRSLNQASSIIPFTFKNSPQLDQFRSARQKLQANNSIIAMILQSSSFLFLHSNHVADPPAFSFSAAVTSPLSSVDRRPCYQMRPCRDCRSVSLHQQNLQLGKARTQVLNSLSSLSNYFLYCNSR